MRIRNDLRAYAKLAQYGMGLVSGQVELTSNCYQHCRGCESWRDHQSGACSSQWTLEQMQRLVSELKTIPTFEHLSLTGGDPQAWEPLYEFLDWFESKAGHPFHLQISTALTQPFPHTKLGYWSILDDVRLSLDAIDKAVYQQLRGDKKTTPAGVLERMVLLQHHNWATLTTVFPETLSQMVPIAEALHRMGDEGPRRAIYLAVLGDRVFKQEPYFWKAFNKNLDIIKERYPQLETSASENPGQVKKEIKAKGAEIPCMVGQISFHMKANGEYYPCCLVGGEALKTYPSMTDGNYFDGYSITEIWERGRCARPLAYAPENQSVVPCCEICQYKQWSLNKAVHEASQKRLAMP